MAPVKKKNGSKPFVKTKAHRQLVKVGICVVTPSASVEEVTAVLGSPEFKKVVTDYIK
ncbi:MAG: hypothetical protein WC827_04595 [Candidatus Paceibacterota bacterium]|jgi:hypothetical protein